MQWRPIIDLDIVDAAKRKAVIGLCVAGTRKSWTADFGAVDRQSVSDATHFCEISLPDAPPPTIYQELGGLLTEAADQLDRSRGVWDEEIEDWMADWVPRLCAAWSRV